MDIRHLGNKEHFLFKKKYCDFRGYHFCFSIRFALIEKDMPPYRHQFYSPFMNNYIVMPRLHLPRSSYDLFNYLSTIFFTIFQHRRRL